MNIDSETLRAEQYSQIGKLLQRDATQVIERWRQRAILEQPNAQRVHHTTLLDHLPSFLHQLGNSLAVSDNTNGCPHRAPAAEHGNQRWETGWSLTEVVRDYQILRLVVLEYLEETLERPLSSREGMAVGLSLDDAIAASVAEYTKNREEHILKIERERTERQKQSEAVLRKWEHIFQRANWGLAIEEPADDTLQEINPAFAQMHGYEAEDLLGKPLAALFPPEARSELPEHLRTANEAGHHVYEAVHLRKDGSRFPVLTHVTAFKGPEGDVLFRAGAYEDITERKRLEESLQLQTEVLKEAHRRKNVFLATLAHELRNPLAPILNSVEVLRLLEPSDPAVLQARGVVERQVKQMARIVDDLLDITRIAEGKLQLRRERKDLAVIVAEAIQTSGPLIESRQQKLSVNLPTEPLLVEVDSSRFVQILANLLNNAAKYTPVGGQISLQGERENGWVVCRVRDTGIGIPPDMLGRIFDLFTQADGAEEHAQGGLGLGLTLVRKLVDLHGGNVEAYSEGLGRGSEFMIRIPGLAESAHQSASAPSPVVATTPRHILIVEDNSDSRQTLTMLLQLLGHKVEAAEDGVRGVEIALLSRPEVALIDIGLPGLDGFQVARQIRAALGDQMLLIALSGYGQEQDRRRALDAGFNSHLVKPVEIEELSRFLVDLTTRGA